jgi:putative transcriptional regulator
MKTRIPEFRARRRMTQAHLAQETNTHRETISLIESGKSIPNLLLAKKIAKHFNTSVDSLFLLEDELENNEIKKSVEPVQQARAPARERKTVTPRHIPAPAKKPVKKSTKILTNFNQDFAEGERPRSTSASRRRKKKNNLYQLGRLFGFKFKN